MGKTKTQKNAAINSVRTAHLDKIKSGQVVTISGLPSGEVKLQLIRLGIAINTQFKCLKRLPGGTIVLVKNRQEIALGYDLAKKISVDIN